MKFEREILHYLGNNWQRMTENANMFWGKNFLKAEDGLNKFEAVVESGSNGLNFLFSGKVGLFLGDSLYSCTKGLHAHTVLEVPVLDIIVMDFYQVEFFWSIGEAFGCDLVFTNFIYAFTSLEYIAGFNRV